MPTASPRAPLVLFLALSALLGTLALALPWQLYGDDVFFVHCIVADFPFTTHFLFLPLARGAAFAGARLGLDPFQALRLLSALGTAAGGALLFAAALRRGLALGRSLLLALLPLAAPSTVFFATAAEVHGLHLGAVGLLAWTLARLSPTAAPSAVLGAGLACGAVLGTHQSGVLFLPGAVGLYLLLTRGRSRSARWRDAAALAAAALLVLAARAGFTWLEAGRLTSDSDLPSRYLRGLVRRIERGWGVTDVLGYLARDWLAPAPGLVLLGTLALGFLARRAPRSALLVALLFLPHVAFFALFDYHELGAYHVPTLPALAVAVSLWTGSEARGARVHPALAVAFVLGVAAAAATPAAYIWWEFHLPFPALPALVAGFLVLGLALPRAPFPAPAAGPALAALLLAQAVASALWLRHWQTFSGEDDPLLRQARGACQAAAGRDALVLTASFQELYLLHLLREPWPEPLAGTWDFAEGLPLPGPAAHVYGDPAVPEEEVLRAVRERVGEGRPVYVSGSVREFLQIQPRHAGLLEALEREYELVPVDDFSAEELHPRRL